MARCEVSLNDNDCEAPANLEDPTNEVRTRCYRCGQRACRSCSWIDRDPYIGRRTRRCRDCREQEAEVA